MEMLPLECHYLNKSALISVVGQQVILCTGYLACYFLYQDFLNSNQKGNTFGPRLKLISFNIMAGNHMGKDFLEEERVGGRILLKLILDN
jgi:hypothetical protein